MVAHPATSVLVVGNPRSSQPVMVSRPGEAGEGCEDGESEGAAEEERVDAGNVYSHISPSLRRGRGGECSYSQLQNLQARLFRRM